MWRLGFHVKTFGYMGVCHYGFMALELMALAEKTLPVFNKYGFRKVGVFGSRARGDNRVDSDADFLYSAGHPLGFLEKQEAKEELGAILGIDVDLVPDTRVIARMRPSIKRDLKIIYEGQKHLYRSNRLCLPKNNRIHSRPFGSILRCAIDGAKRGHNAIADYWRDGKKA